MTIHYQKEAEETSQVVIYQGVSGEIQVDVKLQEETVWLSLNQMVQLFGRHKSVISRHLKNIFEIGELEERAVVAKFATTATDGKTYQVEYYNLDVIISVGYRVNSKQGIHFRRWASQVLKDYLIKGYSLNKAKLIESKLADLKETVHLLTNTLINQGLVTGSAKDIIELIDSYAKTWDILIKYDEDRLDLPDSKENASNAVLTYSEAKDAIFSLKSNLQKHGQASELFGLERSENLKGIIGNLEQSFGGILLYPSAEEKAAHLLYFVIKDHPFSDGNKRIGSLLFLLFLQKLQIKTIDATSMTALALLVAESEPKQKDLMIKLIINLLK